MTIPTLKSLATLLAAGALAVTLSACLPERAEWGQNDTMKRNTVELIRITHDVAFASGAELAPAEAEKLTRFLANANVGYGDRLAIDPGAGEGAPAKRAAIAAHLRMFGLGVEAEPVTYGEAPAQGAVRLIVSRHIVTPPPCPDWRKPASPDYANTASSNFGCATVTNLELMVADPSDLVTGKELGAADAEYLGKAVDRYRAGKVKTLKAVTTGGTEGEGSNKGSN